MASAARYPRASASERTVQALCWLAGLSVCAGCTLPDVHVSAEQNATQAPAERSSSSVATASDAAAEPPKQPTQPPSDAGKPRMPMQEDATVASSPPPTRDAGSQRQPDAAMQEPVTSQPASMDAGAPRDAGTKKPDPGNGPLAGESRCLANITAYANAGPFTFEAMRVGAINFWIPKVPDGCKVPVVHLAVGTGNACTAYSQTLERLAAHGFLTSCYENPNAGDGTQPLQAFQTALREFPMLAAHRFGSAGHSQGGQRAIVSLILAEDALGTKEYAFAGFAMQPATGFGAQPDGGWQLQFASVVSPIFMFSGKGSDGLVSRSWVQDAFNALNDRIEAYHWTKDGSMHSPPPNAEAMQLAPAWFRWKLLNDGAACRYLKAVPMDDHSWEEVAVQNAAPCE